MFVNSSVVHAAALLHRAARGDARDGGHLIDHASPSGHRSD